MFDDISMRMPRTPRRKLSRSAIAQLDRLAMRLDRSGANSRSVVVDASNDDMDRMRIKRAA